MALDDKGHLSIGIEANACLERSLWARKGIRANRLYNERLIAYGAQHILGWDRQSSRWVSRRREYANIIDAVLWI